MQKITPCLWFETQAEEAVNHYTSIFKNSKVTKVIRYGKGDPLPEGTVLTVSFEIEGQSFLALNGGPHDKFNDSISLIVNCQSQAEVDDVWAKLTAEGREVQCGWLKDKYGVSWQIMPVQALELISDKDPAKVQRVMGALREMIKIDLAKLQKAHAGE